MIIVNCKNPEIAIKLLPHFVEVDQDKYDISKELFERLLNNPDETLCLVWSEKQGFDGYAIAYKYEDKVRFWQARASSQLKRGKFLFDLIVSWAKSKNVKQMTCGAMNARIARFLTRKYGFKQVDDNIHPEMVMELL